MVEELDACLICGEDVSGSPFYIKLDVLGAQRTFKHCPECGTEFQTPRNSEADMLEHYTSGEYRKEHPLNVEGEMKRYMRLVSWFRQSGAKAPSKVLDYGCSSGFGMKVTEQLFPEAEIHGYDVVNTISATDVTFIGDYTELDNDYDLIIASHILEHVHNPIQVLTGLMGKAKSDGHILMEVPLEVSKSRCNMTHLFNWDVDTFAYFLRKVGFTAYMTCETTFDTRFVRDERVQYSDLSGFLSVIGVVNGIS